MVFQRCNYYSFTLVHGFRDFHPLSFKSPPPIDLISLNVTPLLKSLSPLIDTTCWGTNLCCMWLSGPFKRHTRAEHKRGRKQCKGRSSGRGAALMSGKRNKQGGGGWEWQASHCYWPAVFTNSCTPSDQGWLISRALPCTDVARPLLNSLLTRVFAGRMWFQLHSRINQTPHRFTLPTLALKPINHTR